MAWTGPERWGNDDLFSGNTPASAALILPEVCEMPDNAGESSLLEGLRLGPRGHAGLIKTRITGRKKPRIWPEPWPGTFERLKTDRKRQQITAK